MNQVKEVEQILNEVQTISEAYKKVAEATGDNFNIFSVLQIESDEVSTHSRFIAALLDPKGQHGLKDAFLRIFVKYFVPDLKLNTEKSSVYTEYYIGEIKGESGGRIDILIDDGDNVIMIENKIYASEQHNQLLRYHNFGVKKEKKKSELLYLTLYGEESKQISTEDGIPYERISYKDDIINWLEECKKEAINIPTLRETISQYINLLKKLTNQNLSKKMNEDIIARVIRDKDSLSAYKALYDTNSDIKRKMVGEISNNIKKKLEEKNFINQDIIEDTIKTIDMDDKNKALISFQTETLKENNLKFRLNFEGGEYSRLIIGFVNVGKQNKNPKLLDLFKKEDQKYEQTDDWNVFMYYNIYNNWHYDTLSKIYFDEDDTLYEDLKKKINVLLGLIEDNKKDLFN